MFQKTGAPERGVKVAEPADGIDDEERRIVEDDVGEEDEDADAAGEERE